LKTTCAYRTEDFYNGSCQAASAVERTEQEQAKKYFKSVSYANK